MIHALVEVVKNTRNAVVLMCSLTTIFEKVDAKNPNEAVLLAAADIIKAGGLVAFPTETVYGLGADGLNSCAAKKIYQAKGRPSDNPLILHISNVSQLNRLVADITPLAYKLMDKFWPGPLTMIFKRSSIIPDIITGGLDTVAIRLPINCIARKLIEYANTPIAAPSANSSGKPSPTRASHVQYDMDGKIDMIIDGGAADFGLESTVVDVTGDVPIILRPGAITLEMLIEAVGVAKMDPAILSKPSENLKPKAPGMKYKHYSPKAKITIVEGEAVKVADTINNLIATAIKSGKKAGVMATLQTQALYQSDYVFVAGDRNHPETIAANLFKLLRKFDYLEFDVIYSESFSHSDMGAAIMNRLEKAAGYDIVKV
jgi:L-threonylcarbamoyladenylate synthase